MKNCFYSQLFKKDFKKARKLPIEDLKLIFDTIAKLERGEDLPYRLKDHPLKGNWLGHRECHLKPDLLLIYVENDNEIHSMRLGSHSELF